MRECKNCEYCDLNSNRCLINRDRICYKNGKCLHILCRYYVEGKWTTRDVKEGGDNGTYNK